jgi:hypothetical protein
MLCTGDVVQEGPVKHDQEFIDSLAELIETSRPENGGAKYEFNEVLEKKDDARVMRHFESLSRQLYDLYHTGDWQSYMQGKQGDLSQSRADLAMVQALCSCTDSDEQVIRLWAESPLCPSKRRPPSKPKAKPGDYMRRTIGLARAHVANDRASNPPIDVSGLMAQATRNREAMQASAPPSPPPPPPPVPGPTPVDAPVPVIKPTDPFPPGLLGDVARYIYSVAPRPIHDLALAAAISYMAGICGRTYNVSAQGLNQYVLVVANSGVGKEGMQHGIDALQHAVGRISNHSGKFIGPSNFTTGAAVQKHLEEQPSCLSTFTEFGKMLVRFNSARDEHGQLLKASLLSAYTKSGFKGVMGKAKYSKDENSIGHINSPNLSILAEGTQDTVFENLPIHSILDGFLPRFIIIEYTGERPPLNPSVTHDPPPQLTQAIASLMERAEQARQGKMVMDGPGANMLKEKPFSGEDVQFNQDARAYADALLKRMDDEYNALHSEALRALHSRTYLATLKLAALVAVGIQPYGPVITLPVLRWAEDRISKSYASFEKRLREGDIGGNDMSKREQAIVQIAKRYILDGPPQSMDKLGDAKAMRACGAVPFDYVRRMSRNHAAFKENGRMNGDMVLSTCKGLHESEVFIQLPKADAKERFGTSNVWVLALPDA